MALQTDTIEHACGLITREVRDHQRNMTVHYIVHRDGHRTEALGLAAQNILSHPASETAIHLLQKPIKSEESTLLGTAVSRKKLIFGLTSTNSYLALCTMNADQFNSLKEVKRHAYHLAWHALDAAEYHDNAIDRKGGKTEIIVRKRNALELASANLRADVFSAVISAYHRDREAARRIALMRGLDSLNTRSLHSPEYYPYAMAMEATEYAVNAMADKPVAKKEIVREALKIAREVGKSFDAETLKNWFSFSEPAQDMAWRGYREGEIIGAAINTSPHTYVRAIGYMVSELSEIKPESILKIRESYSPYADNAFNEHLHNKMVEDIFQDIIAQGLKQGNSTPFRDMANLQNAALTEGKVIGWCASALHAAGKAFDNAKLEGKEPDIIAATEFENKRENTAWDDLKELGKRVIRTNRQGDMVTMGDLDDLARDIEGLKALRQSVEKTMSDPQYQKKLDAANELHARPDFAQAPKTPAPAADPKTPAPAMAIPGLGGTPKTRTGTVQAPQTQSEAAETEDQPQE